MIANRSCRSLDQLGHTVVTNAPESGGFGWPGWTTLSTKPTSWTPEDGPDSPCKQVVPGSSPGVGSVSVQVRERLGDTDRTVTGADL